MVDVDGRCQFSAYCEPNFLRRPNISIQYQKSLIFYFYNILTRQVVEIKKNSNSRK